MTKQYEFNWHIPVPEALLEGCIIDRWVEERDLACAEQDCRFRVDEYGFFIYWKSEGGYGDVIELCQVSDVRTGVVPKDGRLLSQLMAKHGNDLEEKTLTICSGSDFVNINYQNIVFPSVELAQDWQHGLLQITHNNKMNNVCVQTNLMKHWMRLRFLVNPDGKIPVKVITRTFASGRNEKLVYQCLSELNFLHKKISFLPVPNDAIDPAEFTFEKFYQMYHKICPRNDIEKLFQSITKGIDKTISVEQFILFLNEKQRAHGLTRSCTSV